VVGRAITDSEGITQQYTAAIAKNGMWIAEANSEKKTKQNETNTGLQGIQWKRRAGTNEK